MLRDRKRQEGCQVMREGLPRARPSMRFTAVVDSEDANKVRRWKVEENSPLAYAQPKLPWTPFESLHVAETGVRIPQQDCVNPRLNGAVKPCKIPYSGGTKNNAADHRASRRRTSSSGTSSPGSPRAMSSLAAVSA